MLISQNKKTESGKKSSKGRSKSESKDLSSSDRNGDQQSLKSTIQQRLRRTPRSDTSSILGVQLKLSEDNIDKAFPENQLIIPPKLPKSDENKEETQKDEISEDAQSQESKDSMNSVLNRFMADSLPNDFELKRQ